MGCGMANSRSSRHTVRTTSFIWSVIMTKSKAKMAAEAEATAKAKAKVEAEAAAAAQAVEEEKDDTQWRVEHGTKDRQDAWREKQRATKDYALEPMEDPK